MRESAFVKEPCSTIWVLKVYVLELWLKKSLKEHIVGLRPLYPQFLALVNNSFSQDFIIKSYNKYLTLKGNNENISI